jgi:murein lipoprotein
MRRINVTRAATLTAVVLAAGLSGCASTSDLDKLHSQIDQANETARSAAADAAAARKEAAAASAAAADARSIAEDAKATAEATNQKIDRMFKKSMYK